MPALIKIYQHHADDCIRLADQTENPKHREMLLKMADEWTQAIQRRSHDSRSRIPRSTYTGPERRRAG